MANPPPSKTEKVREEIKKEVDKIRPTSDQNLLAALSYAWLVSLVMLMAKRDDEFIRFHARQGVVLFLLSLLGWIPGVGWLIAALAVAGMIIGFVKAWSGERYVMPYISRLAEKIKL